MQVKGEVSTCNKQGKSMYEKVKVIACSIGNENKEMSACSWNDQSKKQVNNMSEMKKVGSTQVEVKL